jgi:hypothetical protein
MAQDPANFKNSTLSKALFILGIFIFAFWLAGKSIDIYHFALVGAIFEFLWLFMLLGLFALPVISLVFLFRGKFSFRSLYLYTFIIAVINILLVFLLK